MLPRLYSRFGEIKKRGEIGLKSEKPSKEQ
jgi:hypothetical protein